MTFQSALWLSITVSVLGAAPVRAQEEKRGDSQVPKMAVFFVEDKQIEGVTELGGFRVGEGRGKLVYLHKEPALFANAETVRSFTLSSQDISEVSGPGAVDYTLILHFTSAARKQLTKALDGKGDHARNVTVVIGRKPFGMQRYEVTNVGPEMCRAKTFSLLFSPPSKTETLRIVNTLLRNDTRKSKQTQSK